jgi:hypothetical protein
MILASTLLVIAPLIVALLVGESRRLRARLRALEIQVG